MQEQWRDIPGYEGYYQASTLGRIRSVDRVVLRGVIKQRRNSRILTQCQSNRYPPYYQVILSQQGRRESVYVHRLIAMTWIGPIPLDCEVRHGPNGFADNSPSNLCYGTDMDNENDKERDETSLRLRVRRSDGAEFASISEAARESGCRKSNVTAVCAGRRKSTGGYGWSYI